MRRTRSVREKTRDRERDGNQRRVVGITLWYAFNVGYNVYNKKLSNALDYPMLIALTSLGVGILYFAPLWALGLRKAPKLTPEDIKACTQTNSYMSARVR